MDSVTQGKVQDSFTNAKRSPMFDGKAIAGVHQQVVDNIIMPQVKFLIWKSQALFVLSVWEDAAIEGDRIRPFVWKMTFRCLNLAEARSRLELVSQGDWDWEISSHE